MADTTTSFFKRILDAWPVLAALITVSVGLFAKVQLQGYRIDRLELDKIEIRAELKDVRAEQKAYQADIKGELKELNGGMQRLELAVTELVTIQKQASKGNSR